MAVSYATTDDIPASWRPTTEEKIREATDALELAGILIRRNVDMSDLDVNDEREIIARHVSLDMIKPVVTLTAEQYGKVQYSTSVGGIADSATLLNPSATLFFTDAHKALFGIGPASAATFHFGDCPP